MFHAHCPDRAIGRGCASETIRGTERVVHWLTEELVELGHEVTLFASGDSVTSARLVACSPKALRLDRNSPDPMLLYAAMLARVAEMADQFDVVHAHLDWIHIPLLIPGL